MATREGNAISLLIFTFFLTDKQECIEEGQMNVKVSIHIVIRCFKFCCFFILCQEIKL